MIGALPSGGIRPMMVSDSPALASRSVARLVTSSPRRGRVLGASTHAVWCAIGDDVVVIGDRQAVPLPNALIADSLGPAVPRSKPGDWVRIGFMTAELGGTTWRVVRWWEPRVAPAHAAAAEVAQRVRRLELMAPYAPCRGFGGALRSGDPGLILEQARRLLGRGPGLTPEGDDMIVGAVAAFRHVALSVGGPGLARGLDAARGRLESIAGSSTSQLSATLVRHAFVGEVASPVGDLLRSLTGRGDPDSAMAQTLAIGSSSGRGLAAGVLCGAAAACGEK